MYTQSLFAISFAFCCFLPPFPLCCFIPILHMLAVQRLFLFPYIINTKTIKLLPFHMTICSVLPAFVTSVDALSFMHKEKIGREETLLTRVFSGYQYFLINFSSQLQPETAQTFGSERMAAVCILIVKGKKGSQTYTGE